MKSVSAWILSILGIVIIGTIIDLILPSGRMNKYIKSIFATVTILIIILPLPSLIKNGFKFDGGLIKEDFQLDENFIDYSNKFKVGYLERGMQDAFTKEGLKNIKVTIKAEIKGNDIKITQVTINLVNLVISENLEHINKYELIDRLVTTHLKVNKEVIVLNE